MNRPELIGIRHIALRVQDVARMRDFYTKVLGFRVEWEPDHDNVYLTSGGDNLALHASGPVTRPGSLDHLGLLVAAPETVDAWAGFLKERGIPLKQEPKTHRDGARSIYFHDPEDNLIQLIYHPPISGK